MSNKDGAFNLLNILETDDQYALMLVNKMILTLLNSVDHKSKFAYKICSAAEGNFEEFYDSTDVEFPKKPKEEKKKSIYNSTPQINKVDKDDWNALIEYYTAQVAMYEEDNPQKGAFLSNLSKLVKLVGFDDLQENVLSYVYAISATDPAYRKFFNDVLHGQSSKFPALIAMAMEETKKHSKIAKYFGNAGVFTRYGLIEYDGGFEEEEGTPVIESFLKTQLSDNDISDEDLVDVLIGKATDTNLTIKDNFPHLETEAKRIQKIVKAAYQKGEKGINIAIYGPTGSGKTEFVKAIAKMMGMNLFAIGESAEDNMQFNSEDKKVAAKRMSSLFRAQAILKGQKNTILLMDEFEDFVSNKSDSSKQADPDSKIALNRMLEENFTVTFYNCNDIGKFHDSFRNRFFTSLFVGYQPTRIRQNIWAHHLSANGLVCDDDTALSFARRYEAPPRNIEKVCKSAALQDGDVDLIHEIIQDSAKIAKGHKFAFEAAYEVPEDYDVKLVSSKNSVHKIGQTLQRMSKQNAPHTLLIAGEKGTGKSTFAYHQAEKMIRSPIVADMKDIVIPTQFSTPDGNLARVFMAASDANALLVIDNMDAMFRNINDEDRESLPNVFWSFMEAHKAPVILTTRDENLIDESFRAFLDDTITFTPMDEKTHKKAAQRMFGNVIPLFTSGVVIGDFARTARSIRSMPMVANDQKVIEKRIAASASASGGNILGFNFTK